MSTSTTTTAVVTTNPSSPKSVAHHDGHDVHPFLLNKHHLPIMQTEIAHQQKRPKNESWVCPASNRSKQTNNPVGSIIDPIARKIKLGCQRADGKNPISLASGDAAAGGHLPPCAPAIEAAIKASLNKPNAAGYVNACGTPEARIAIARHHSYYETRIHPENVIVTNGCSGAIELALASLLDEGSTLLVPQPGFPLYEVIAKSHGANVVHYHLNPNRNWECDMAHLEQIMSTHTNVRAMVINNPSSTTGSVFTETHMIQIAEFACQNHLPIVSDEVYGDLTFGSNKFHPMARIAARLGRHVPVITTSGLSKQFLVPGWRVGWLAFHDNVEHSLREVEAGANRLAQINHGTSQLSQAVIPTLLNPSTPHMIEWKQNLRLTLKGRATSLCKHLYGCHGLEVIAPQGAMHAVVKIDTNLLDVEDDVDFVSKLVDEENVFVLPGKAMGVQDVFRIAYCCPEPALAAAARRIHSFCRRHTKKSHAIEV